MRVGVTAGYNRSRPALLLAESMRQAGHEVLILVVSPFQLSRFRQLISARGRGGVVEALRKIRGRESLASSGTGLSVSNLAREIGPCPRSLRGWASGNSADFQLVPSLNHDSTIRSLSKWNADLVLYCGGGILREGFLTSVNGPVLNAHAGPLPDIRGMNAVEWSILLDLQPAVTIHQIDAGIDTGPVLQKIPLDLHVGDTVKILRDRAVAIGIQGLLAAARELAGGRMNFLETPRPFSRQCFSLSPVLKELLERKLAGLT